MLIHGFTGCADSAYMLATARHLLEPATRSCVSTCAAPVQHDNIAASSTTPDAATISAEPSSSFRQRITENGLAVVGFSFGGNMLLKYLGEEGEATPLRYGGVRFRADRSGVGDRRISARRNWPYHRWLVANTKRDWFAGPSTLDERQQEAVRQGRSLYASTIAVVGPLNGFSRGRRLLRACAAKNFLARFRVPTMIIHAVDDPMDTRRMYERVDWAANDHLTALITGRRSCRLSRTAAGAGTTARSSSSSNRPYGSPKEP